MATRRFDVPVVRVGACYQGNTPLILCGCVGAEDIEAVAGMSMNASPVGLGGDAGFGGDAEVDVL